MTQVLQVAYNMSVPAKAIRSNNSKVGWLVVLLFYVHGKHLRSCWEGQLT